MDGYKLIDDDDAINFDTLDTHDKTLFEKEKIAQEEQVLKSLREDYISSLREEYDADEKLFDAVEELLEESDDQNKLLQILDSL